MNPEGAPPPASRLQRWLLGLLLVWSFAVRLVFSWPDPTMNRIWDERYNAGNVAAILAEGQFQPVRAHYPTLSYMPHALLLKTWEAARSLPGLQAAPSAVAMAPQGRPFLTPFGVRACRFLQVVVGTASLWVLYLIGRRLFGPGVALTAVLLLSVTPWHLRQSGAFKPDIMMVLASVVALYAMLAARNPGGASPRHQRHSPSARLRALGCNVARLLPRTTRNRQNSNETPAFTYTGVLRNSKPGARTPSSPRISVLLAFIDESNQKAPRYRPTGQSALNGIFRPTLAPSTVSPGHSGLYTASTEAPSSPSATRDGEL